MRTRILSLTSIVVVALGATACSTPTAPRARTSSETRTAADTAGWLGVYKSGYIVSTGGHGRGHDHGNGNGSPAEVDTPSDETVVGSGAGN